MNYVSSICLIETFLLMKLNTLFYHYHNLFAFVPTKCNSLQNDGK